MLGASQVSLVVKNPPPSTGDLRDVGSILGSGSPLEEEVATQSNFSCLKNPTERGAWRVMVHKVEESQTRLK